MITLFIDLLIIILIILGGIKGWKYGGITSAVSLIATIFIFVAAFYMKDIVAPIMYENLPFFKFAGIFEGISSLNILLYEVLAYVLCIIVLLIILAIILKITNLLDKLINLTIILALPNKILGLIFGAIQYYIIVYFLVFILIQLPFTSYEAKDSQIATGIVDNTPVLSDVTKDLYDTYNEVYQVCNDAMITKDKDETNKIVLENLMKREVITFDHVKSLRNKRKIEGQKIDELINEYNQKNENKTV